MSLSASIVCHKFCIYNGKSFIGTFSFYNYFLWELSVKYFLNPSTAVANYYFSSIFEGKKKAFKENKSFNLMFYFPGGFGMLSHAYSTFLNSFSLKTLSFSFYFM